MIIQYLERIIISYKIRKGFNKLFLIIDSVPCHLTQKVKDFCDDNNIFLSIIPPRMTNLLQPADVFWFATLKKEYSWYIFEDKTFTINDNMKSPGYVKCLDLLSDICNSLDD